LKIQEMHKHRSISSMAVALAHASSLVCLRRLRSVVVRIKITFIRSRGCSDSGLELLKYSG
jgi:hypothetical protein